MHCWDVNSQPSEYDFGIVPANTFQRKVLMVNVLNAGFLIYFNVIAQLYFSLVE